MTRVRSAATSSWWHDPVDPTDPIPAAISPTHSTPQREEIADADPDDDILGVDAEEFPVIYRLREGLTEDRFEKEFSAGLQILLTRIDDQLNHHRSTPPTSVP